MGSDADDVQVSSVVYNLAGPDTGRTDFLRSLVVGAVRREAPIGEVIASAYLKGPGVRYRNFIGWARSDPDFTSKFGTTTGSLAAVPSVNLETVRSGIPPAAGQVIDSVDRAEVFLGRIHYWVLQYMYLHHPGDPIPQPPPFTGDNTYAYDANTDLVTIRLPGSVVETFKAFTPEGGGFIAEAHYLYARYVPAIPAEELSYPLGSTVTLAPEDPDPLFPLETWSLAETSAGSFEAELTALDVVDSTYSDGRAPDHYEADPIVTPASAPTHSERWVSDVDGGTDANGADFSTRTHKEFWNEWEVSVREVETVEQEELDGGVIRTITTVRTEEFLLETRKTRVSTQKVIWKTLLDPQWHIYASGIAGASLEDSDPVDPVILHRVMREATTAPLGNFYPAIPLRWNNRAVATLELAAVNWLVDLGDLGFEWTNTYNDVVNVELAATEGATPIRVFPSWLREDGRYAVRSADPAGTVDRPLHAVLEQRTADSPGVFRLRDSDGHGGWLDAPWQPMLAAPEPNSSGFDPAMAELYPAAKKAFKKATGSDLDGVLDSLAGNESLGDIDYAYAVFGVSLNTKENAARKYVWKFLEHLRAQEGGPSQEDIYAWENQFAAALDANTVHQAWWDATHDLLGRPIVRYDEAGYQIPPPAEPARVAWPPIPWQKLTVGSSKTGEAGDYRSTLCWAFIDKHVGNGVLDNDGTPATKGELFFTVDADPFPSFGEGTPGEYAPFNNRVTLNWQKTADEWEKLIVTGMAHTNHVWGDYSTRCTAKDAVNWTRNGTYEEAPFIVPLHETVFRELSLVDATQMAGACTYLVLNCYEANERHWYESTWFRVVLIVVVVALSIAAAVVSGGASLGASGLAVSGLVGGGVVGVVIGALVDIAVGMAVSYLITWLATEIFGEKVGSIVGAVAGLVLGAWSGGGFSLQGLTQVFSTSAGWMALGIALTNGTAGFLNASAKETQEQTAEMLREYDERSAELQKEYDAEFGRDRIDPASVNKYINEVLEKPGVFLTRTLMTGSDIVEATLRQIGSFADDRLRLALP